MVELAVRIIVGTVLCFHGLLESTDLPHPREAVEVSSLRLLVSGGLKWSRIGVASFSC